jgi:hypothetical protein
LPPLATPPLQYKKDRYARLQKVMRRHQGEAAESEDGDATPNLLLKHPDTTLAIYI